MAPGIVTDGMPWAKIDDHDAAGDGRDPDQDEARDRDTEAGDQRRAASETGDHALGRPASDDRARLVDQPAALDGMCLELRVELPDGWTELRQLVALDEAVRALGAELAKLAQRVLLRRPDRSPCVERSASFLDALELCRCDVDTDLAGEPEQAVVLPERDLAARRQVEHRGRQRPARRASVHDQGPRRRGQVRRWGRHQDRRVVEVDRILALPAPRR